MSNWGPILGMQDPDELRRMVERMPDDDPFVPKFLIGVAHKYRLRFIERGMVDVCDIDQAIASSLRACKIASDIMTFILSCIMLGEVLLSRSECLRNSCGLQEGIDACRIAIDLSENASRELRAALRVLARITEARFQLLGASADVADIEEAFASRRRVLELTTDDDPQLPTYTTEYATCFLYRLNLRNDVNTLREACTWLRRAVELLPDTHANIPWLQATLGRLLTECFAKHHGNIDDLHEAIVVLGHAVELAPYGEAAQLHCADRLSTALSHAHRYAMHSMRDYGSLAQYDFAVDILPQEHRRKPRFLNLLAASFRARFLHNYNNDNYDQAVIDIDMAIALHRRTVEAAPPDGLLDASAAGIVLPVPSDNLASALLLRLKCPNNVATFSSHISTVDLIREEHPEKPVLLTRLAESLRKRFESDRDPEDFVRLVTAARHALQLKPDTLGALRCLGCSLVAHSIYFKAMSSATDNLDEAIPLLCRAVQLTSNSRDIEVILALARASSMRFARLGHVFDIERAITLLDRAIKDSDGQDDNPAYLAELADVHHIRFRRYSKTRDIEEAIQTMHRALNLLPSRSSQRSKLLVELAHLLSDRFLHLRHYEDIDRAVEAVRDAASRHPQPGRVHLLAAMLIRRSMEPDGPKSGFDEAVNLMRGVIMAKQDPAMQQQHLAILGHALAMRFQHRGVHDDLDQAVAVSERALSLSAGSGEKGEDIQISASLALCYLCRFDFSNRPSDLEKGIRLFREVLDGLPSWVKNADMLQTWVRKLISRLRVSSPQVDHLRDARDAAEHAFAAGGGATMVLEAALQFTSLSEWAGLLPDDERQGLLTRVTKMYEEIINLIPEVAWLGDDIDRRFERLAGYSARNIVGAAVAHALEMNEATKALEWFEQGRAIVWTQIHGLRTPVDELRAEFPDIADRLERTAQALENAGRGSASFHSLNQGGPPGVEAGRHADDVMRATLYEVGSAMLEGDNADLGSRARHREKVEEHRRLAEEYRELLDEIRGLAGFKNFLRPRSKAELSPAALHGAVACINMHSSRCDALVLYGSKLHHVPLPDLTPSLAQTWQQSLYHRLGFARGVRKTETTELGRATNKGLLRILQRMWAVVVQPIFAFLGWTDGGLVNDRRIKWCTRSSLAFLPLHAAGPYDGSSLNAFDIAISSYTSTLAALLPDRAREAGAAQPSILVVAQADAPGGGPLPGTKKECAEIRKLCLEKKISSTFLIDAEGTADAVLKNITAHPYVHLACHGIQGVANPMTSAFLLANGSRLTLRDLMEGSSGAGELAFLSACETSKGHEKIPDEAAHLAAGMLAVGYRSVVGTLWSIRDSAAPFVAEKFYKTLLEVPAVDGRPDVAYALHIAARALRVKVDDDAVLTWVPFIHFGL